MALKSANRPQWCRPLARKLRQAAYLLDPVQYRKGNADWKNDEMIYRLDAMLAERELFLDRTLSIDGMASRMGTNRTTLSRALHSRGRTFASHINRYRIGYAARQLFGHPDMDITEIAEISGFTNVRSLRYFVRSCYGITLTDFRQRISLLISGLQEEQIQRPCRMDGLRCRQRL